jgi:preprotein translocase subunit SecD
VRQVLSSRGQNVGVRRTTGIVGIALLLIAAPSGCGSNAKPVAAPTSASASGALVVFTTWVADPKVTNGPEPGYRPALTGLTGHDIQSAAPVIDATGSTWLINIAFTPQGANLFAKLTRANVSACPGDPISVAGANCPQRHLGIWLDLTQTDIDSWEDPIQAAKVSKPYDLACLMNLPTTTCAKFLSDPITLQEITGRSAVIGCACTEQGVLELAAAVNSARNS